MESAGLRVLVNKLNQSFLNDHLFVGFIGPWDHEFWMSIVAHCAPKLGDPTFVAGWLTSLETFLSQRARPQQPASSKLKVYWSILPFWTVLIITCAVTTAGWCKNLISRWIRHFPCGLKKANCSAFWADFFLDFIGTMILLIKLHFLHNHRTQSREYWPQLPYCLDKWQEFEAENYCYWPNAANLHLSSLVGALNNHTE